MISKPFRQRRATGSALLSVLIICFTLLLMIAVISEEMTRYLAAARGSIGAAMLEDWRRALGESIAASYWNEAMVVRVQAAPNDFTEVNAGNVVANAAARLGAAGANGTEFAIGNGVYATVTATLPGGNFDMLQPNDFNSITNTCSWLDGVRASQRELLCVFRMRCFSPYSGNYVSVATNTFLLCQIPSRNLPLSALGALTINNSLSSTLQGTTYLGGDVTGGNGLDVRGGVVTGNAAASGLTQEGEAVTTVAGGWTQRGYTEIAKQGNVRRNLDIQRSVSVGVPVRPDYLFREGLSAGAASPEEAAMLEKTQPYYQVPSGNRFFGIHNPAGASPSALFALDGGSGADSRATTFPAWMSVTNRVDGGVNRVVCTVDPLLVPPAGDGSVRIFVGSRHLNGTGAFDLFRVQLKPAATLPAGVQSFSIITPNDLIFLGDFNSSGTAVPTSVYAARTYFGSVPMSSVDFTGTMAHVGGTGGTSMNLGSADGSSPAAHTLQLQASTMDRTQTTGADLYYWAVLRRFN